jgi:magnesium-transporting ATPase (P-type)
MNIFEELQTNEKGLTSLEAEKRLEKYGRNELPEKTRGIFFYFYKSI